MSPSPYCLPKTCDISQGKRTLSGFSGIDVELQDGFCDVFPLPVASTKCFRVSLVFFYSISLLLPPATPMISKIWIVKSQGGELI